MDTISYKTQSLSKAKIEKNWVVIDAADQILGRFSSRVANVLRGKTKASYTPNMDCGDNVIILNAEKVRLTGKKMNNKTYIRHTGYPGGQRFASPRMVLEKDPRRLVEMAVRGMLPKNSLGREQFRNLYVYAGTEHPHAAQQPKEIKLTY
ncbi:50S ribosomal protein L13 [Imperialibacter roseus]|jgi:large subunit ribosomal protein L13|uniref:Large ribosomal subunit protein uL13 n=1 Tax=Imperialibacter roseus TaxID=1324217 RepID=A0ABZ0IPE8_9BACT|nr:50S ribosomal protein L13 [Imperialibacter roseus]WOK06859.1 50S ribosomal protein L13 [Imperialibacter roseus]|tara:strand:- start:4994 stop:5443 length:450 start_codon:yes stop_codon:yes gene_type:complete